MEEENNVLEDCTFTNALTKLKQKRNHKKNSSKHAVEKRKTRKIELIQKEISTSIRLYLLNNANPKAQINLKDVKKISEKN